MKLMVKYLSKENAKYALQLLSQISPKYKILFIPAAQDMPLALLRRICSHF